MVKEEVRWGIRVIESDAPLDGPENKEDMWEGEKFNVRGGPWG